MIAFLKSDFFKTEKIFDRAYMSYLERFFLEGEEFLKNISPYKSGDVVAWFTNKRIIFTSASADFGVAGQTTEIEFLLYKSIQRYSFLDANTSEEYKIELFISDKINVSFFMTEIKDAAEVLKLIGEKCG